MAFVFPIREKLHYTVRYCICFFFWICSPSLIQSMFHSPRNAKLCGGLWTFFNGCETWPLSFAGHGCSGSSSVHVATCPLLGSFTLSTLDVLCHFQPCILYTKHRTLLLMVLNDRSYTVFQEYMNILVSFPVWLYALRPNAVMSIFNRSLHLTSSNIIQYNCIVFCIF